MSHVRNITGKIKLLLYIAATLLVAVVLVAGWGPQKGAGEFWGEVLWVYDGDTIKVAGPNGTVKVRLLGIDCPEKEQPYSKEALQWVIKHSKGKRVFVRGRYRDKYGRLVANVELPNGNDLGAALVAEGLAWHYRHYSDDPELTALEYEARKNKRGLWQEAHPVSPWEFKHK